MRRLRLLFAFFAISCCVCGHQAVPSPSAAADPLLAVHNALFSSFLLIEEIKQDPRIVMLFTGVRYQLWSVVSKASGFRQLLLPFADLRSFGAACGVSSYLLSPGPDSFASLTSTQRELVLFLLESCDQNEPRRLSMTLLALWTRESGALKDVPEGTGHSTLE